MTPRINMPIGKLVRENLTLTVELPATGMRWFAVRLWLGRQILVLAARVIGCGIEIKDPPR